MNQTKPEGSCASTMEDLQERIAGMDVKEDDGPTFGSTVRLQKDDGTTFAQDLGWSKRKRGFVFGPICSVC